jgi:uncharacterized membrane protein
MLRMLALAGILSLPAPAASEKPDFGPDGLAGLSDVQILRLSRGEVILPKSVLKTPQGQTLIEAAVVFDRPPEEVWNLLTRTEDQRKYLKEVKKVDIIFKEPAGDLLEMTVKILGKTIVYRQFHHFDKGASYFWWELDPSFPSQVKELSGFWRFYPFPGERTLARYGSRVQMRFGVPSFIQVALVKNGLPSALRSTKRYIDSGGRCEKD